MRRFAKGTLAATLLVFALVSPAQADFGLKAFDADFLDESEAPALEAGTHPAAQVTEMEFNTVPDPEVGGRGELTDGDVRDLNVSLPPGFVGNPTAVATCTVAQFSAEECPLDSQVGTAEVTAIEPDQTFKGLPLWNIAPPPGQVARFGFQIIRVPVTIDLKVNQEPPFNVSAQLRYTSNYIPVYKSKVTVSGLPPGSTVPFLTLPRACTGPLPITYSANSWQDPGSFVSGEGAPATMENCEGLDFGPTVEGEPTTTAAESPSGFDFDLDVSDPGLVEPGGTANSDIRKTVVTLPEGITTNPAIANGLEVCSLAQYEAEGPIDDDPGTGCPQASKVGSVDVTTPLLDESLQGSVYVAKQHDNPFDALLGLYVVIKNPTLGVSVRLAGKVEPDPQTGRLTTTFDEMPQFPLGHLRFHFEGGDRAPLITPPTCGTYEATADLYPYSDPGTPLRRTMAFEVNSPASGSGPCPTAAAQLPHSPGFSAGTLSPVAGAFSPFVFRLERGDGSQRLSGVTTVLPKGLLARLAGVPYCTDGQIAQAQSRSGEGQGALEVSQPSCPAASRIGSVLAGAGAGPHPYYVSGSAYLAGPYQGAPLSVEIVTPAIAGPFDLGVVAVRTPLYVDPETGVAKAVSDPLPQILHGLPLDLRSISLQMDRPQFTFNPTSCEPSAVTGDARSVLGATSPLYAYFQADGCGALPFKPKLSLRLAGSIKRSSNPRLIANLTAKPGEANIGRAQVKLPAAVFLDQSHIRTVCTRVQFAADQCPARSIYGKVEATTPILDYKVTGPVYLRSSSHELPDLVAKLEGPASQPIEVALVGKTDSVKGALRNTFEAVPDAPVSTFHLELFGGKRGLVEMSDGFCRRPRATVRLKGQNGKTYNTRPAVKAKCPKPRKPHRHKNGGGR